MSTKILLILALMGTTLSAPDYCDFGYCSDCSILENGTKNCNTCHYSVRVEDNDGVRKCTQKDKDSICVIPHSVGPGETDTGCLRCKDYYVSVPQAPVGGITDHQCEPYTAIQGCKSYYGNGENTCRSCESDKYLANSGDSCPTIASSSYTALHKCK
jgi:hypothetical protein